MCVEGGGGRGGGGEGGGGGGGVGGGGSGNNLVKYLVCKSVNTFLGS